MKVRSREQTKGNEAGEKANEFSKFSNGKPRSKRRLQSR
jgi:hypothetical protein